MSADVISYKAQTSFSPVERETILLAEIISSRIQVARKITSATMELYWNIGKELSAQHLNI